MVQVYQPNAKRKVKPQCYTRWGWILGGGGVGALKRQKRKAFIMLKHIIHNEDITILQSWISIKNT